MSRKPKFRPTITRVKLNPEQVVLECDCYSVSVKQDFAQPDRESGAQQFICRVLPKGLVGYIQCDPLGSGPLRYKLTAGATSS